MSDSLKPNTMNLTERQAFLRLFPCFAALTAKQSAELAALWQEVTYLPQEIITVENDLIASIYIIVSGAAEVTHLLRQHKKIVPVPIAILRAHEGIGLNDTGFYSKTGKRTATVTAITKMHLLRLDIKDLSVFLKKHHLESSMYDASLQMLRMLFIKQCLPFSKLSHERLQWLAHRIEEKSVPAQTILFHQGQEGDQCYLLRSGHVEILFKDETGHERELAVLKAPALFGEATVIAHERRNATAKTKDQCELFVLRHDYLLELIESESDVAKMFMNLMIDRSRPLKNPHITVHERMTADGQSITILKNPDNHRYFKLSREGAYIWQQLDGHHTMQDITLGLAEQCNVFAPNVVAGLISKLTKSGYLTHLEIKTKNQTSNQSIWIKTFLKFRHLLEWRIAFGDTDAWITKMYARYVHYLFSKVSQLLLSALIIIGFISFVMNTENILAFFSIEQASILLILGLIPLSLIEVMLHELGHAFAVKAFGREVHYIGVGWYWLGPIAFTDTSDMWLSARKPRMWVNLAGVYVDFLVASFAGALIFLIPNMYVQSMLWLFALYTYVNGFRNLNPIQEMDGYYVLMDWVEKPKLRQSAVVWLVKKFMRSLRQPQLFRGHFPEIMYWIACVIYLIFVSLLTLILQGFVLNVFNMNSNIYISLILPFLVVIFSCLSVIADINKA